MNVPFQSIHFMVYEFSQSITNPERHYNPKAHMVSGACAGGIAAAITTPLDVCKTFLNTQPQNSGNPGMIHALRTVYKLGGLWGYFKGLQARVIYQMPSTAICWSMYELFKYLLTQPSFENSTPLIPQSCVDAAEKSVSSSADTGGMERWVYGGSSSVSGAGIYGAYSFNTVHNTDTNLSKSNTYIAHS